MARRQRPSEAAVRTPIDLVFLSAAVSDQRSAHIVKVTPVSRRFPRARIGADEVLSRMRQNFVVRINVSDPAFLAEIGRTRRTEPGGGLARDERAWDRSDN